MRYAKLPCNTTGTDSMRLPNLLATKHGRLTAFFLLYVTEGIPLGFAATAVATRLRRLDVGPAEIGAFVASFYLPWAFKWAFGAMQDVAIDALACSTLQDDERGLANGMMFAVAMLGSMLGGSGVLFLSGVTGFQPTFHFVTACILSVTVFVVWPMQEVPGPARAVVVGSRLAQAGREMRAFAVDSFRAFLGSPGSRWMRLQPDGVAPVRHW
jgi:PAT family beta-lactamase induction signal transducer AmpG